METKKTNSCGNYLNFNDPQHRSLFYNHFHGEEKFQLHCPTLYKIINQKTVDTNRPQLLEKKGKAVDLFCTYALRNVENHNVTVSQISLVKPSAVILISTTIKDKATDEVVAANAQCVESTTDIEMTIPYNLLSSSQNIIIHTIYSWVEMEEGGPRLNSYEEEIELCTNADLVKNISVEAPVSKKNDNVVIVYQRTSQRPEWDYQYNYDAGTYVIVMMPFKGDIECANTIEKATLGKAYIRYLTDGGCTYFKNISKIDWQIKDRKLEWSFPEIWDSTFDRSKMGTNGRFAFYAELHLHIKIAGVMTMIPVYIQSGEKPGTRSGLVYNMQYLNIQWGCFGKESKILMADGSLKRIDQIQIWESVRTSDGRASAISNIYMGYESEIIVIRTITGKTLKLTGDHPVMTERGLLRAEDLKASDQIQNEQQTFEALDWLYTEIYNDEVFNIDLEESGLIIADGLCVGDFRLQNTPIQKPDLPHFTQEELQIAKEVRSLFNIEP
ncbi:MAG: Hint domain-containing protein [Oscillospiraceae bacterium]